MQKPPLLNLRVFLASRIITSVSLSTSLFSLSLHLSVLSFSTSVLCAIFSFLPRKDFSFSSCFRKNPQQVILSTIHLHHCLHSSCTWTESEPTFPFGFSGILTGMKMREAMDSTATVSSPPASNKVYQHNSSLVPPLPDILSSPTRRMCGQCWRVLIKKGFVTPTTMFGLERGEKTQDNAKLRASFTDSSKRVARICWLLTELVSWWCTL